MSANPKNEKIIIYSLLGIGFLALFLGFYKIFSDLNLMSSKKSNGQSATAASSAEAQAIAAEKLLKTQDTDKDGISDYDELNVYKTSPYLADSDSDNINDRDEIVAGTDPNCPIGKICKAFITPTDDSSTKTTISGLPDPSDIAAIRKLLISNGMTQNQVDAMSDEEIKSLYQQAYSAALSGNIADSTSAVVNSLTNTSQTNASSSSALGINSISDLQNLTGAQIRELLKKQGASDEILNKYDDAALKKVFSDKLNEKLNNTNQ